MAGASGVKPERKGCILCRTCLVKSNCGINRIRAASKPQGLTEGLIRNFLVCAFGAGDIDILKVLGHG
ncbi:MAG: hypothetical protein IJA33_03390, partial [Oscillospiraceae bacterium]|nr:hypothetical protein [Oscillospiraceae bacterium]